MRSKCFYQFQLGDCVLDLKIGYLKKMFFLLGNNGVVSLFVFRFICVIINHLQSVFSLL